VAFFLITNPSDPGKTRTMCDLSLLTRKGSGKHKEASYSGWTGTSVDSEFTHPPAVRSGVLW
jgi:hypothetical protein